MKKNFKKGMGLVEVMIGSFVALTIFLGLISSYMAYLRTNASIVYSVKSAYLGEEGIEVVKQIKNSGWTSKISGLSSNTNYYISFLNGNWSLTTTLPGLIDGIYDRKIVFQNVYRDSNDDITSSGGAIDNDTKKVDVTVSYSFGKATTTSKISAYISNVFGN